MNATIQRGCCAMFHQRGNWTWRMRHLHSAALDHFRSIMGDRGVAITEDALSSVNVDWTGNFKGDATAVLAPASTTEVSKVLSYCNDHCLPVVPMGGNTGLTGGAVPGTGEAVLSFARMNKILGFQEGGVVVCESGCILEALDGFVAERGFRMPLDLGAKGSCQIGGNLATNAGGLRFLRYGSLRGSVLGLEAVLPDGTIVDCLKTLRKDNTGYDLKQLFIGSEGTLGAITKVAIQCVPSSTAVNTLLLAVSNFAAVHEVYSMAHKHLAEVLSAFEFFDAQSMELAMQHIPEAQDPFRQRWPIYVLVETSGSNDAHDVEKLEAFVEACSSSSQFEDAVIAQDMQQAQNIWQIREGISESLNKHGRVHKYDMSMAPAQMYDLVEEVKSRLDGVSEEIVVAGYGHYGDGNLHLNVSDGRRGHQQDVQDALEPFVYEWVKQAGGSVSAEHGIGLLKRDVIHFSRSPAELTLMRQIKRLLDPNGIMNPGKVLPGAISSAARYDCMVDVDH
eukprot:jgi/Ulvmu1/9799/UM056_0039.1